MHENKKTHIRFPSTLSNSQHPLTFFPSKRTLTYRNKQQILLIKFTIPIDILKIRISAILLLISCSYSYDTILIAIQVNTINHRKKLSNRLQSGLARLQITGYPCSNQVFSNHIQICLCAISKPTFESAHSITSNRASSSRSHRFPGCANYSTFKADRNAT